MVDPVARYSSIHRIRCCRREFFPTPMRTAEVSALITRHFPSMHPNARWIITTKMVKCGFSPTSPTRMPITNRTRLTVRLKARIFPNRRWKSAVMRTAITTARVMMITASRGRCSICSTTARRSDFSQTIDHRRSGHLPVPARQQMGQRPVPDPDTPEPFRRLWERSSRSPSISNCQIPYPVA